MPTYVDLSRHQLQARIDMFVLIDDCSRYMWTALLKEKSEAFEKFKTFKVLAEQETHTELKTCGQIEEENFVHGSFRRIARGMALNDT